MFNTGLRAKPSDKSIFSPSVCNCWVTMWAEVYIRSPTGDLSWIMRIQNDDQDLTASTFPDLPLANISSLLRGTTDHSEEFDELLGEDRKIDSSSLPENEYETLLEEHFNLPSTGGCASALNTQSLRCCCDRRLLHFTPCQMGSGAVTKLDFLYIVQYIFIFYFFNIHLL